MKPRPTLIINNNKIKELIKVILNDIEYYKNKPHFIQIIEQITDKKEIIEEIIINFEKTINYEKDYTKKIIILEKYIKKFEKKYVSKIETSDGVIYEYENEFKYYPNKKSKHIESFFKTKFLKNTFDEIIIDGIKRNEKKFTDEILLDIRNATTCFIKIFKTI